MNKGIGFLSDESVVEYIEIYKQEFGKDISFEKARIQAENLLKLMGLIISTKH